MTTRARRARVRVEPDVARAWEHLTQTFLTVIPSLSDAIRGAVGLEPGAFSVLRHLRSSETPGRLRLWQLKERLPERYSQPGLTRLVQRMEAAGLVQRRRDPADGRGTLLTITPAGRTLIAPGNAAYEEAIGQEVEPYLTAEEAAALAGLLERFLNRRAQPETVSTSA